MPNHHLDRRAHQLIAAGEGGDDDMLTPRAVAEWLGVSEQWLALGRNKGYGPPFQRMSSQCIRYPRSGIRAWLAERLHRSTAEYRNDGRAA